MKKKYSLPIFVLLTSIAGHDLTAAERANEAEEAAKLLATQVCSVCHGPGGQSTFSSTPNLAAQPRQYLAGKMKLFRNHGVAKPEGHIDVLGLMLIDDPTTDALARYFANQPPPTPIAGDAALVTTGSKIFVQGLPEQGIAACSICHGTSAAGFWIFPRLAGQHAEYVERQLELIQLALRDAPVMHGIIKNMTPVEMKAVAAFVQSKP